MSVRTQARSVVSIRSWAGLIASLYGLTLAVAALPLVLILFDKEPESVTNVYRSWLFWVWFGVLALDQAALLIVPVGIARGRPIRKRGIAVAAASAGLAMGALAGTGLASVIVAARKDDIDTALIAGSGLLALNWIAWSIVFWRYAKRHDPTDGIAEMMRRLLRGSVLELLVAVPCHVYVRHREDCCAPGVTAMGIATGLAVLLASFGPGVIFLYARRVRDRRHVAARAW